MTAIGSRPPPAIPDLRKNLNAVSANENPLALIVDFDQISGRIAAQSRKGQSTSPSLGVISGLAAQEQPIPQFGEAPNLWTQHIRPLGSPTLLQQNIP